MNWHVWTKCEGHPAMYLGGFDTREEAHKVWLEYADLGGGAEIKYDKKGEGVYFDKGIATRKVTGVFNKERS